MPKSGAPSLEDIQRDKSDQVAYWKRQQDKNAKHMTMYFNEHDVEIPGVVHNDLITEPYILRQGKAGEICDHAFGLLDMRGSISIDVPGRRVEEAEKWSNLVRATAESEQGEDTDSRSTFEAVTIGYSGIKVYPDPKAWSKGYPRREDAEADAQYTRRVKDFGLTAPIPISMRHVPARTWFPLLNGNKVVRSYEVKPVTRAYIEARYGPKLGVADRDHLKNITEELELVEYVDDTYCAWYVSDPNSEWGKELRTWAHQMPVNEGQAPVVLVEGLTTGDPRPGYRWKSLIEDIYESIKAQDFVLSRTATMVMVFYWLTINHRLKGGGKTIEEIKKEREYRIGGTNFVLDNEELTFAALPSTLPDGEALYDKMEERIRRAWPPVLQGVLGGESSGYLYNLVRDSALQKLRPLADHLAQSDADVMRLIHKALGALDAIMSRRTAGSTRRLTVFVRETRDDGVKPIGLSWDAVKDLGPLIRAKREADMPVDTNAKIDAAIKAWTQLKLPWDHAVGELYGAENPQELKEQREIEDIEAAPQIQDRTFADVLAEIDLILNDQEGMTPEQTQQAMDDGQTPPPGLARALAMAPQSTGAAIDVAGGVTQPPGEATGGPAPPSVNPRAGTMTQPGGPHMEAPAQSVPGASQ